MHTMTKTVLYISYEQLRNRPYISSNNNQLYNKHILHDHNHETNNINDEEGQGKKCNKKKPDLD